MVNQKGVQVAPSLLAADFGNLAGCLRPVESASPAVADFWHLDVMDGHFVPNITMGPMMVAAVRRVSALPVEAHLMVWEPEKFLPAFAQAGVFRILVHAESTVHLYQLLQQVREHGCQAGVALNPGTPLAVLEEVWPLLDVLLIMTVEPGFGGQAFIPAMLDKIARARREIARRGLQTLIEVDGGIAPDTVGSATAAGARILVAGTAIFGQPQAAQAAAALRQAAERGMGMGRR